MQEPGHVVMRVRPVVQLVAVPLLGVFVVGIAWALVDAVTHADAAYPFRGDGFGALGVTVGWVIATVVFLASAFTVPLLLRLRVEIWDSGFDARGYVRHYRLDLAQVTQIRVLSGSRVATPQPKFPGIRVTARAADGRRRGFQLNSVYTGTAPALPVFDAWVRARPDLVRDPLTREVFTRRGVLAPAVDPARGPAGPAGQVT